MVDETTEAPTEPTPAEPKRRHGWASLYAVAFVLMLGAGAAIAVSSLGTLRSLGLLRLSMWLSAAAIVVAIVAVLLPRRS